MEKAKFIEKLTDVKCRASYLTDLIECLSYIDYSCQSNIHRCIEGAFSAIARLSDGISYDLSELETQYNSDNSIPYKKAVSENV